MVKRSGFTLVELLVVIAIISLLIAIIAPTLGAAKDLARSSYCMTTLNALNKSSLVYTDQNRGFMMVYRHHFVEPGSGDYAGGKYIESPDQPSKTAIAFTVTPLNPATGLYSDARNYGLVYAAKILEKPEMFYCPAPISDDRHRLSNYGKPWGGKPSIVGGTNWVRCGYMWDPWVKILEGTDSHDGLFTFEDDLLLERHRSDRFLTSDLLWGVSVSGHVEGTKCHWNLGYPDGHVMSFEDPVMWKNYIARDLNTGVEWELWNTFTRPYLEKI